MLFLPSILSILAKESGYNIVTDPNVNRQDKVSIHLDEVPIEQAINLVVRAVGLSYEVVGNSFLVADPKKLKEIANQGKSSTESENFTILVIDDDSNAQELMKKFLTKENYDVLQATSGLIGLELAKKRLPDLITLDVMMPEMDGWEVLSELQSNELTKNIPVIMLTMANEPDLGYSLGATDYLTKPIDWKNLSKILKKHEINTGSQSILIVEDDDVTRDMLKKSLETHHFKVLEAINGKEALERVQKGKPGLILLDLMMPKMNGFEFLEAYRTQFEKQVPVIVITGADLDENDKKFLSSETSRILEKSSMSDTGIADHLVKTIESVAGVAK